MLQAHPHAIHFKRILDFGEAQDARPSTSPIRLSPGVRLPNRHSDLYFRGELCSNDAAED
jgi:hypothetical protein